MENKEITLEELEELAEEQESKKSKITIEEEEEELTNKASWIKKNKLKDVYKKHTALWKYIEDDLDPQTYEAIAKAIVDIVKNNTGNWEQWARTNLSGYFNEDKPILKPDTPQSYKEGSFKRQFPNQDKKQFLNHMLTVITGIGTNNYQALTPLAIMAKFGVNKKTLLEWINDPELVTSASDTHKVLTAKEVWDIYDIKFQAILAEVAMPHQIEKSRLHSLAIDSKLGVNALSEDTTFEDTDETIDFKATEHVAVEQSETWDDFLGDVENEEN